MSSYTIFWTLVENHCFHLNAHTYNYDNWQIDSPEYSSHINADVKVIAMVLQNQAKSRECLVGQKWRPRLRQVSYISQSCCDLERFKRSRLWATVCLRKTLEKKEMYEYVCLAIECEWATVLQVCMCVYYCLMGRDAYKSGSTYNQEEITEGL